VKTTAIKIGVERDKREGKKKSSAKSMPVINKAQPNAMINESRFKTKLLPQNYGIKSAG
jgi:hypothetical protein